MSTPLASALVFYGESLLRLNEARQEEADVRNLFDDSAAARTKAAEDVFHVAAEELAETWRAEFKDVAMQLMAAIQPVKG